MDKLQQLEEKIKKLQSQKNLIEQKEKAKEKKLLNKQKILVGGYIINKLKNYDDERLQDFILKVIETIPKKRKFDIEAVEKLEILNK